VNSSTLTVLFVCLCLLLPTVLFGQARVSYFDEVIADAPVGYWRLNEADGSVMSDATSNGLQGTYFGGVSLQQPGGLLQDPNKGVSLDGVSGYMSIPNSSLLQITGDVTVEAWVYLKSAPVTTIPLVGKLGMDTGGDEFNVWIGGFNQGYIHFFRTGGGVNSGGSLPINYWFHVVCTVQNGVGHIYINGREGYYDHGPMGDGTPSTAPVIIGKREPDGASTEPYYLDAWGPRPTRFRGTCTILLMR